MGHGADRGEGGAARGVLPKMFTLPRGCQAAKKQQQQRRQQLLLNLQSALRVDNSEGEAMAMAMAGAGPGGRDGGDAAQVLK